MFWSQSPATFTASLKGRVTAREGEYELALFGAWQAERFARLDKLKPLKTYLKEAKAKPAHGKRQSPRDMLGAFETLRASGVPMTIRRIR